MSPMSQEVANFPETLPEFRRLRVAVVSAGLKQYDVAERLGISESHLSRLLSGRKTLTDEMASRIRLAITELAA